MNIVKLELNQRNATTLAPFAKNHSDAIAAEPEVFVTPDPTPAAFNTLITTYNNALAEQMTAQILAQEATKAKDAARRALEEGLRARGMYVAKVAAGNAGIVNLAGFAARAPRTPAPVPATPIMLPPQMGTYHGSVLVKWNPVPQVRTYELQMCADPKTEQGFKHVKTLMRCSFLVRDLVPGQNYWFRVAAIGTSAQSEWTDAVMKTVAY